MIDAPALRGRFDGTKAAMTLTSTNPRATCIAVCIYSTAAQEKVSYVLTEKASIVLGRTT
jgi:hypothetical protein